MDRLYPRYIPPFPGMEERSYPSFLLCMDCLHIYFFSFSSTQLFSYILPMFPPLSLLAGKYMVNLEETGHISKLFLYTHLFFSLITAGAIACAPIAPDAGKWSQWFVSAAMLAAGLIAAYLFKKGRFKDFLICQGFIVSCFVFSVWFTFGVTVTRLFTSESIALELKKTVREMNLYILTHSIVLLWHFTEIFTARSFLNLMKKTLKKQ